MKATLPFSGSLALGLGSSAKLFVLVQSLALGLWLGSVSWGRWADSTSQKNLPGFVGSAWTCRGSFPALCSWLGQVGQGWYAGWQAGACGHQLMRLALSCIR